MAKGDGGMGRFANAAMRGGNAIQGAAQQPGLWGANPNFGGGKFNKPGMMGGGFNPGMFNPSGGFGQLDVMPKQPGQMDQQQPIGMGPSYDGSGIGAGLGNRGIFGGGFAGGFNRGLGNKFGFGR